MHGARGGASVALFCAVVSIGAVAADCEDCARPAIAVSAVYTEDAWRNTSGGLAIGSRYLDNIDRTFDVDGEQAFGIEGMKLFAYALYDNGHAISEDLVGSAQRVGRRVAVRGRRFLVALITLRACGR